MKRQIGLLLIMMLLISGCGANATNSPSTSPASSGGSTVSTSGTLTTVVDKRSGIAFDFPVGWSLLKPTDDTAESYTYSFASYDLSVPSSSFDGGIPDAQTEIEVTFYSTDTTPESARSTTQSDVDNGFVSIVKQETRTAPDGSPAYYYALQGRIGGTAQVLYTRINGHTVSIVAYGKGDHFDDVIKSLRGS